MKTFIHNSKIIWAGFRLSFRTSLEFGFSSFMSIVSNLIYIAFFMLFWQTLLSRVGIVPGWSLGQMAIYLAFTEFFQAVVGGIGGLAIKTYVFIINGRFDIILTRPTDPKVMLIVFGTGFDHLIRSIPSIIILITIAYYLGTPINWFGFLMGLLASTLAAIALILLHFTGSFLSFWIGSVKVIEELAQSLDALTKYPLTILDNGVRIAFTLFLPIGYAVTEPALSSLSKTNSWLLIGGALFLLIFWLVVSEIVWRKGIKIYESSGG